MEEQKHAVKANSKIVVECLEDKKWKVTAKADISAGELLLEEQPIVSAMLPKYFSKVCHFCAKESSNLQRCSSCKYSYYCSQDHQIEDWKKSHKKECSMMKKVLEKDQKGPIHTAVLLVKTYAQVELLNNSDLKKYLDSLPRVSHLIKGQAKKVCESTVELVLEAASLSKDDQKKETYLDYLTKIMSNGILILGKKNMDEMIACGVYPAIRKANHSCEPNAFSATNAKLTHRLVAARDIKAGEEITCAYIDLDQDVRWRQAHLFENYFFRCSCNKCLSELKDQTKLTSKDFLKEKMYSRPANMDEVEKYVEKCKNMLAEDDYAWFLAFDVVTETLMRLYKHEYYYGLLKFMMEKFEKLYSCCPINPIIGRHYHKLACLAHKLGDKSEAIQYSEKALKCLEPYFTDKYVKELKIIIQHTMAN